MTELDLYPYLLYGWLVLAAVTLFALLRTTAPYGRHRRGGWGPDLPARLGWMLMELPAVLVMAGLFVVGEHRDLPVSWVLLALWLAHYLDRSLIYPWRLGATSRPMPLSVAAMALLFNCLNGYLNGRWLFELGPARSTDWLNSPTFLAGNALFVTGFVVNRRADKVLLELRRGGDGYRIPRRGLFERISCPNYLGEIVQWLGWALLTWSLAGLAFALWTLANLLPRALAHHRWYRRQFADYPPERKALIPFLL